MLTDRDRFIVRTAARSVRAMTDFQAGVAWWPDCVTATEIAQRRLRELASQGWLDRYLALARPLLCLTGPLLTWKPGDETPNFGSLAWKLRRRWNDSARSTEVFVASSCTLRSHAIYRKAGLKNHCQTTHDLHVTSVFVHMLRNRPALAKRWVGEDEIARRNQPGVRPDALIVAESGRPSLIVEFGGAYQKGRVEHIHAYAKANHLPYEIW